MEGSYARQGRCRAGPSPHNADRRIRAALRHATVAVSGRRDQEAPFFTVVVWRDQAEHAAESLSKGSRVVVVGRLQQRSWTAEVGSARSWKLWLQDLAPRQLETSTGIVGGMI
jgi:single-stranded DNA-binding protein